MNLTDALPQNELILARLAAAKLAKVMHGIMSVGTASLGMETSMDFLTNRDKTPLGFLEVLGCIGVRPGHEDKIPLLRERVKELADVTSQFHRLFIELTNWRSMLPADINTAVERLGDSYSLFCQRLGDFCSMLGMESDFTQQVIQDRSYLIAAFRVISPKEPH
jgi:hypothetical protein